MKRLLVFLLSLVMVLGFGACSEPEKSFPPVVETKDTGEYPYTPVSIYNAKNEKIGELEQSGQIFPTDDGFVYSVRVDDRIGIKASGGTSDMEYYLYTASTGEKVKIGSVDNWYTQSNRIVLLQNHLFFFVVTSTEEEGSISHYWIWIWKTTACRKCILGRTFPRQIPYPEWGTAYTLQSI